MLKQAAENQLLKRLAQLEIGSLQLTTHDGKEHDFVGKEEGPRASIALHDENVANALLRRGDIGLAEEYRAGRWESDDLVSLVKLGLLNRRVFEDALDGSFWSRLATSFFYFLRSNTLKRSVQNIHAHYDLGNDFYGLWLDPSMTYSSAIFNADDEKLEQGQRNKYDRILDHFAKASGSLLEVGCGWGGFMNRALERGDYEMKGLTLSSQQHAYAKERLKGSAQVAMEDYRIQEGAYDQIVSIEMFEAVGKKYWPVYFQKIAKLLNKGGQAVIQTITINEHDYPRYKRSGDFIRSFIFPGGMLPSSTLFARHANLSGLQLSQCHSFGQDYVRTLSQWLKNFDDKYDQVRALGFDDGFVRLWRLYLASCIAGFATERTNVMQVELTHMTAS